MAVTLQYSIDRGVNWTTISTYTHPTTAGVHHTRIALSPLVDRDKPFRWRLTGTDAADWGLREVVVKAPVVIRQERDLK